MSSRLQRYAALAAPLIVMLAASGCTAAGEETPEEGAASAAATTVQVSLTPVTEENQPLRPGSPGPEIRVDQGDHVRIVVHNDMTQPTVVHFHGLTVPNDMDGVPFITQDPIMPGGFFTYEFDVVDQPGMYVYHSHFNSTEQVGKGLYGAFYRPATAR